MIVKGSLSLGRTSLLPLLGLFVVLGEFVAFLITKLNLGS